MFTPSLARYPCSLSFLYLLSSNVLKYFVTSSSCCLFRFLSPIPDTPSSIAIPKNGSIGPTPGIKEGNPILVLPEMRLPKRAPPANFLFDNSSFTDTPWDSAVFLTFFNVLKAARPPIPTKTPPTIPIPTGPREAIVTAAILPTAKVDAVEIPALAKKAFHFLPLNILVIVAENPSLVLPASENSFFSSSDNLVISSAASSCSFSTTPSAFLITSFNSSIAFFIFSFSSSSRLKSSSFFSNSAFCFCSSSRSSTFVVSLLFSCSIISSIEVICSSPPRFISFFTLSSPMVILLSPSAFTMLPKPIIRFLIVSCSCGSLV